MALHFTPPPPGSETEHPAYAIERLRAIQALVASVAGGTLPPRSSGEHEQALVAAYEAAPGVVRRRTEVLIRETASSAAVGLSLLTRHDERAVGRSAAAHRLSSEMAASLRDIEWLLLKR